jgi:N-acetylglutamate synthase-like GNAT family acetyltransferase
MAGTPAIRSATAADRTALEALQRRASLNNPNDRAALLAHPDAIDLPDAQIAAGGVHVLECDGTAVGFAALLPRADGDVELDGLFVEPACWRRGFGRRLVEHCAEVAAATGARWLHVVGNPHARAFYLACAFEEVGEVRTRFGPASRYRRKLRRAAS